MDISKELEKNGIIVKEKIKIEEKNAIAKAIAEKLADNIIQLSDSYNELYMRIFNCDMYYAEVDSKYCGVFYFYKNNAIYIDKESTNTELYLFHEIIHYLQNFSKISKKSNRAGLCRFMEFKIFGLGLNEAIVQYITAKALGEKIHRISNEKITICTNSENYYKYMTSLVGQILLLMGEKDAIESCIFSTDKFETEIYNTFEENTEKILKKFDTILAENSKLDRDENKIIEIYMEAQEVIYTTYFSKMCKRLNTVKEVDDQVEKLSNYGERIGRLLNTNKEENKFIAFEEEMESKFLKKYIEVNRKQSKNALIVYKNKLYNTWRRIIEFIQRKIEKNKM